MAMKCMKSIPLMMSFLLLAGCSDKEAEEAAAKARAEEREARREAVKLKARAEAAEKAARTAKAEALQAAIDAQSLRVEQAEANLEAAIAKEKESKEALEDARDRVTEATRLAVPAKMTDEEKLAAYEAGGITGVPIVEAKEIIRKAKLAGNAWRANYEIEAEGKGYAAVQEFSTKITQMPTAVRDEIVNHAKREHPGDWSRMGDEVTAQSDAWFQLEEWRKTNVPGLTRAQSATALSAAITRWPGNWKMALFTLNDEVKRLAK